MKKKLFFLSFTVLSTFMSAQNPEGFTYQAVARDGSGIPLVRANLQVKISILSDTTGFRINGSGTYLWEELQSKTTTADGILNLIVGNPLAAKVQGTAGAFSEIDWSQSPLYIGIKILPPASGWKNMGASRLWSVPYSMVAKGLATGSKLSIVGGNDASAEALFEVKRKDGQTVFAVYNYGAVVYVPDDGTKKAKGGFAVGGYDQTKGGMSQNYMSITPDSIRFYIDNALNGSKKGFAVGGFDQVSLRGKKYLSLMGASRVDTAFNARQIMWYPVKEAFLAGNIDVLHPDSVGLNSFSMGYKNQAIGDYSQALGYQSVARGDYSTAIGRGAIAGTNSFALGNSSKALGNDAYALGSGSKASGLKSLALGVGAESKGMSSVTIGFESLATQSYAVAIGYQSKATASTAHAFGLKAEASADGAIALGMNARAQAVNSTSLGYYSNATNLFSTAIGYYAQADGPDSYAIGSHAEADAAKSFAIGSYGLKDNLTPDENRPTQSTGYCSLALGMGALSTGTGAMSMGINSTSAGDQSLSMGYASTANGMRSIAIGAYYNVTFNKPVWEWNVTASKWLITYVPTLINNPNRADDDYSISIGNGNRSSHGALSLGTNNLATSYGSVALGHSNSVSNEFAFAAGFMNNISGQGSFALGNNLISKAANSFVIGAFNLEEGTINEWLPKDPLFVIGNGNPTLRSNAFTVLKDGNIVLSPNIISGTGENLVYDPVDKTMKRVTSSSKYKSEIESLSSIDWFYNLNPVSFRYENDPSGRLQYGLIAEEMENVNSNLVFYSDGEPEGINYNGLYAPIIKAVKDQKTMIDDLVSKNSELSEENEILRERLSKLESIVNDLISGGR